MNAHAKLMLSLLICLIAVTSKLGAALPPITAEPTDRLSIGSVVWADLLTDDPQAAIEFYEEVFGWEIAKSADEDYWLIRIDGERIAGIALHQPRNADNSENQWLVSLSVADVGTTAELVEQQGGEIIEAPQSVSARGRMAIVADPQGAAIVLLRSAGGDPQPSAPARNNWLWSELWTRDTVAAASFLRTVADYEVKRLPDAEDDDTLILGRGNRAQVGVVSLPFENVESHWLNYIAVDNIEQTLQRIQDNGGSILVRPASDDEAFAIVSDPTGGVFAVYAWEFSS